MKTTAETAGAFRYARFSQTFWQTITCPRQNLDNNLWNSVSFN